ncbi:MAG: MFS transporter [Planctomycetaceae bacterium]
MDSISIDADIRTERHNTTTLIMHQVLFRVAWIFKTESVVMPAFLDSIASVGWMSGLLPPINRLGQSVTPLLLSGRLQDAPVKSRWLPVTTLLMGVPFLILSVLVAWPSPVIQQAMPVLFLCLYAVFFATAGTNQWVFNTVQGKLITAHRRGRMVAIAGYVGSPVAILAVLFVMRPWVHQSVPMFGAIFLFTGCAFITASFCARFLREDPDQNVPLTNRRKPLRESIHYLREDRNLRQLCVLSGLVACTMVVFPYYQRLGRSLPGYESRMLMDWVICQNLGAAIFSWIAGRIADSRGTRSALRMLTLAAVLSPLIPLALRETGAAGWYWITFLWLGTVPITFRMKMNYVLELTEPKRHPIYLSTAALSTTPVIFMSPVAGVLITRTGYGLPFLLVSATAVAAWIMTLFIVEPRSHEMQTPD